MCTRSSAQIHGTDSSRTHTLLGSAGSLRIKVIRVRPHTGIINSSISLDSLDLRKAGSSSYIKKNSLPCGKFGDHRYLKVKHRIKLSLTTIRLLENLVKLVN